MDGLREECQSLEGGKGCLVEQIGAVYIVTRGGIYGKILQEHEGLNRPDMYKIGPTSIPFNTKHPNIIQVTPHLIYHKLFPCTFWNLLFHELNYC